MNRINHGNYLMHYGVKGMKWGVRRYQNYDGTLKNPKRRKKNIYKEPSKKEVADYRKAMIKKYSAYDKETANFYKNASDKEIREKIRRQQTMKKIMAGVGVGVGVAAVGAGIYCAYKYGMVDEIAKKLSEGVSGKELNSVINNAVKSTSKDIAEVLDEGSILHRMDGHENFNLEAARDFIYTTINDEDRETYKLWLADPAGAEGRFDVSLEVTDKIAIPTVEKAEEIFDSLWKKDKGFRESFFKEIAETYRNRMTGSEEELINLAKEKYKKIKWLPWHIFLLEKEMHKIN